MANFHLHIDALTLSSDFERYLIDGLGFWRSDFVGHPAGREHYEPKHHLTLKSSDTSAFQKMFAEVKERAALDDAMHGYIEGEVIMLDQDVDARKFDSSMPIPFRVTSRELLPDSFRESEIHITLSRDDSDQRLIDNLLQMGFYCAYLPKDYEIGAIFTMQGSRKDIDSILPGTIEYIESAGGAVNCSIKEERIAHWWLSESDVSRPPVIDHIEWATTVA